MALSPLPLYNAVHICLIYNLRFTYSTIQTLITLWYIHLMEWNSTKSLRF